MCGIHVSVAPPGHDTPPVSAYMERQLRHRGPDHYGTHVCETDAVQITLTSAVLALRGDALTRQPIVGGSSALCWNGEAWRLSGAAVAGNDGAAVFAALEAGAADGRQTDARRSAVLAVLRAIEGPFAFVYYDGTTQSVWYGRDRLGRRSLVRQRRREGRKGSALVLLASVAEADEDGWVEVAADGIYVVDVAGGLADREDPVRYPWSASDPSLILGIGHLNEATEPPEDQPPLAVDSPSVQQLREQLHASLRLRVTDIPQPLGADYDTRLAILFSGGLDCTVLARMAHDLVPAEQGIDLVNVAFENPRVVKAGLRAGTDVYEACPDRVTGRTSFQELQAQCPGRAWRFVPENVSYNTFVRHRSAIVQLIRPHNTEMDLSIAAALYFAAGSQTVTARVLLSGLGADELFGGYGRHGIAFTRSGYAGLVAELALDVGRLGQRNLGRDDRATARWGREVRYPFLDEGLVGWALGQPVWAKCDFGQADGGGGGVVEPAKRVLRLVAVSLRMTGVAQEKKRAIQFGARTAKMESGRTRGTTVIS